MRSARLGAVARFAADLVHEPRPGLRWRRAAAALSAAIFALLLLAGSSLVALAHRETGREEGRTPLLASKPSPTDLIMSLGDDVWDGRQFTVFWIQPTGSEAPVLPPGMDRLPEPGGAAVSPALDRLASRNPAVAARYRDRLVLGERGVRSGDELLAYVRLPEGRDLSGYLSEDARRAVRVGAFGPPSDTDTPSDSSIFLFSETPSVSATAKGVLGFLVVPGLAVLVVGVLAAVGAHGGRLGATRRTGGPAGPPLASSVQETLFLAVPGLVAVAVLWGLVSPRLERVPLVGHDVFRGDLGLPWWLIAAETTACFAALALVVVAVNAVTVYFQRRMARPETASLRPSLLPLYAASFGVALGVALLAAFALGWPVPPVAMLIINGIVAAVIGVLVLLPGMMRAVGANLGRSGSPSASLAGRELERNPWLTARPFLGGAALIAVALAASGYIAMMSHDEPLPPSSGQTQAAFVDWLDPRSNDPDRLGGALRAGLVVPFEEHGHAGGHGHDHHNEAALVVGTTCRGLAPYFPGTDCDQDAPYQLPQTLESRLVEMLGAASHRPRNNEVRLVPADDVAASGSAVVLDDAPIDQLDMRVRDAALQTLPAPRVESALTNLVRPTPIVTWIATGIVVGLVTLALGYLASLMDDLVTAHEHRRRTPDTGETPGERAALEAWRFAAPYFTVIALAFCCAGLATCVLMSLVFPTAPMPWRGMGVTLGFAVVIGLVGTGSAAFLGARDVRENPE